MLLLVFSEWVGGSNRINYLLGNCTVPTYIQYLPVADTTATEEVKYQPKAIQR